jgi:hypothetical protein
MAQNVLFKIGTRAQFDAIVTKNQNTLYWLRDTQELYKGDILFGTGALASETVSGLLSAEDYKKLQELINAGVAINLEPVDGSIVIKDKKIGIGLSAVDDNILVIKEDGLFAAVDNSIIETRLTAVEGSLDTINKDIFDIKEDIADIKESLTGGIHYRGSVSTKDELPMDAQQGDLYECIDTGIEYCWNGTEWFEYGSAHFVPVAGAGIIVNGSEIGVKIADESHGLTIVEGSMAMLLATDKQDGAMSKEDKAFIDDIPKAYATIDRVENTAVQVKYNISATPEGTLVNYGENEIRIMCPANAKFVKQQVGNGGNANMYYMTFTTYAPDGAVTFKEGDRGTIIDEVLDFENTAGAGVDKYGRKYKNHWFALAMYDESSDTWTYFGKNSSVNKYIGWNYVVEWYDANGVKFAADSIRINLSNEDCHNVSVPYYMNSYVTDEELDKAVQTMSEAYSWGEM